MHACVCVCVCAHMHTCTCIYILPLRLRFLMWPFTFSDHILHAFLTTPKVPLTSPISLSCSSEQCAYTHNLTCNNNNNNFTQTHFNCDISCRYQFQLPQEIITMSYNACSSGLLSSSAVLDCLDAGKGIMSFTHAPLILLP